VDEDPAARKAVLAFEKAARQPENEHRKEEAARAKKQERRQRAIASAEAALEKAKRERDERVSGIETVRAAVDRRSEAEESRWEKQKEKLEGALRRAHTQFASEACCPSGVISYLPSRIMSDGAWCGLQREWCHPDGKGPRRGRSGVRIAGLGVVL
jgi:hypothetical protein